MERFASFASFAFKIVKTRTARPTSARKVRAVSRTIPSHPRRLGDDVDNVDSASCLPRGASIARRDRTHSARADPSENPTPSTAISPQPTGVATNRFQLTLDESKHALSPIKSTKHRIKNVPAPSKSPTARRASPRIRRKSPSHRTKLSLLGMRHAQMCASTTTARRAFATHRAHPALHRDNFAPTPARVEKHRTK